MQDVSIDGRVALSAALTVRNAGDICATLLEAIRQRDVVSIDCSAAAGVDVSFIQLLVAARNSAAKQGKLLGLTTRPDGVLLDALIRGGFRVRASDPAGSSSFWFEGDVA